MTQEPTEKQMNFLRSLMTKGGKWIHGANVEMDRAAEEEFGYEKWDEAPLSRKVVSCVIDIYLGKADAGLYVWAVRRELEAAA